MSQGFDAHIWVRKVFKEDLSVTDLAVQRAVRKVQERVDCWKSYPEGDADKYNAYPEPNFPQARSCWPPYYRAHLDDGREPDFDVEKDHVHDINYENELCLPCELDYD